MSQPLVERSEARHLRDQRRDILRDHLGEYA